MSIDKNSIIRNRLLNNLEDGIWKAGSKLPGARQLAAEMGCCFTHMQTVLESLVQQGILLAVPRGGTFVRDNWEERLLPGNLVVFQGLGRHPLELMLRGLLAENLPELRYCHAFKKGIFEIQVSHSVLGHHGSYMDLAPLFQRIFPDRSRFFERPMTPFYVNGKLCGVPIIFSPRFLVYDRRIFQRYGVPEPRQHWTFEDFLATISQFRGKLPPALIYPWNRTLSDFYVFSARFGGYILDPETGAVRLDGDRMMEGLRQMIRLRELLGNPPDSHPVFGESAMWLSCREELVTLRHQEIFRHLAAVQLPLPEGGRDANLQTTQLLCIRNECANIDLAEKVIRFILSEEVQNHFAANCYGVPMLRSAISGSLDPAGPVDSVIREELDKVMCDYSLFDPGLYHLVSDSIRMVLGEPLPEAEKSMRELSNVVRFVLRLPNYS